MDIRKKIETKVAQIAFCGLLIDIIALFAIIVIGVFGNEIKDIQEERKEQERQYQEQRIEQEQQYQEQRMELEQKRINDIKRDIAVEKITKKSENEFNLRNTTTSDFLFPLYFDIKDSTNLVIRYNSEYNEDYTLINQQALYSGMPVGTYNFPKLPIGKIVIKNVDNRINEFLEENENGIIKITVRGTSDNTPVSEKAIYIGDLGYGTIHYNEIKEDNTIEEKVRTLTKNTQLTNEDFALLRAYSVVAHFKKEFNLADENIQIFVQIYKHGGPRYRRCDFSVTLENYFGYQLTDRW